MTDTILVAPTHRDTSDAAPPPRRSRAILTLPLVLLALFVAYSVLAVTWWPFVHWDYVLNRNWHVHPWFPELHFFDRVGQRVLCLRALALVVMLAAWWYRTWRPVLLAFFGVFALNLLVLIVKLALSRGDPLSGQSFFSDGDLYPSGHASNVAVVYGLCYYLVTRYWAVPTWARRAMLSLVCVFALIQFTTSILLRWHWFSDLIGGFLIGALVLALTAAVDAALPLGWRGFAVVREWPELQATAHVVPERELELAQVTARRMPPDLLSTAADRRFHR